MGDRLAAIRRAAAGRPSLMPRELSPVLVAIGEPNPAYAAALETLLGDEQDLIHAGTVDSVDRLVALIGERGTRAAILDVHLPGGGVVAVAEHLERLGRPCRLIAIASVLTPTVRRAAARAGAVLVERADGRRLLEALSAVEH